MKPSEQMRRHLKQQHASENKTLAEREKELEREQMAKRKATALPRNRPRAKQ